MSSLKRRFSLRSKNKDAMDYHCTVRLLDDAEVLQCEFKRETTGQELLDHVCSNLNLIEKDYFGLRYVDSHNQRHWMDPLKPVYKQLKGIQQYVLCFRVKFYPEEPTKLHEEITRYQIFLQLRRDLLHGRLYCGQQDAAWLAAYIIQSELGDYEAEEHQDGYISEYKLLLKQTPKLEEKIKEIHKDHLKGQVPSIAEMHFLDRARHLDTYGVDPHPVKDQKGNHLYLGITYAGILLFQGSKKTHHFRWQDIQKIHYEGKMFIVHLIYQDKTADQLGGDGDGAVANGGNDTMADVKLDNEDDNSPKPPINGTPVMNANHDPDEDDDDNKVARSAPTTPTPTAKIYMHSDSSKKKSSTLTPNFLLGSGTIGSPTKLGNAIVYKCPSAASAKHHWRLGVEYKEFFTADNSKDLVQHSSGGGLFSRGSKFRYSGRVEKEIARDRNTILRNEPTFERTPLKADAKKKVMKLDNQPLIDMTLPLRESEDDASPPVSRVIELSSPPAEMKVNIPLASSPTMGDYDPHTSFDMGDNYHPSRTGDDKGGGGDHTGAIPLAEIRASHANHLMAEASGDPAAAEEDKPESVAHSNSVEKDRLSVEKVPAQPEVKDSGESVGLAVRNILLAVFIALILTTLTLVVVMEGSGTMFNTLRGLKPMESIHNTIYQPTKEYILHKIG